MHPTRFAIVALTIVAALAAPLTAAAQTGSWTIAGHFERTTAPSFQSGFVTDDIDAITASFDHRAKALTVDLRHFEAPSRGAVQIDFGLGQPDGTCLADRAGIAITAADIPLLQTVTETERFWSPDQHRWEIGYYWPGSGWTYLGWNESRRRHHWLRPGRWETRTVTREISGVDEGAHQRTAILTRDGVGGELVQSLRVETGAVQLRWSFAHPLLDGLQADCLEIHVPGRAAPFALIPVPAGPAPEPDADPEADDRPVRAISIRAGRRGSSIALRLTGDATRIQIRAGRATRTLAFRPRIVLRHQAPGLRTVAVRTHDGSGWSDWRRVRIR